MTDFPETTGAATEPAAGVFRGVAAVPPLRHRRPLADTADLPAVTEPVPDGARPAGGRPEPVTPNGPDATAPRQRPTTSPYRPGFRQRWRVLRRGAGWSWLGGVFVVLSWGVWAVSVRGSDPLDPVIGLGLVLVTGLLMFVAARLLGWVTWERMLGRVRRTAWPSHLTAGAFLTLAGVTFLQQTRWIRDTVGWVVEAGRWVGDHWPL